MAAARTRWLTIAATAVLGAGLTAAAQQPRFRAGIDLVHLPVVVTARGGALVRGLTIEDFQVFEDGKPQRVSYFAEGAPGEALPLHLGLMLDASGSMERDIRDAASAAIQFVDALEEAVDVTFVDFDTAVSMGRFARQSFPLLFERIRARKSGGMTALYDALASYLENALGRSGQHVLLLYTDGGDSASRISYGKLMDLLRTGDVIIYAVGYLENQSSTFRVGQQMRIAQIARETGGDAFFPGSPRDLSEQYARILDELASRYTLGYVSSNTAADGKFRKVEVKLSRPDVRGAKLRTRTGYMAPASVRRP